MDPARAWVKPCVRAGVLRGSSSATVLWFLFPGHCRPFLSYQRMYSTCSYSCCPAAPPGWPLVLLVTVSLLPGVLKKVLCRQLWPSAIERVQVCPRGAGRS